MSELGKMQWHPGKALSLVNIEGQSAVTILEVFCVKEGQGRALTVVVRHGNKRTRRAGGEHIQSLQNTPVRQARPPLCREAGRWW